MLKNGLGCKQIERILYASIIESFMYTQTCTMPNVSFVVRN